MEKPPPIDVQEITKNAATERAYNYNIEVSRFKHLIEAVRNHVVDTPELQQELDTGEELLKLAENGEIVLEVISMVRNEMYRKCIDILNDE